MLFRDLNPFVRYAHRGEFFPLSGGVRAYDGRLFYLCRGNAEVCIRGKNYSMVPGSMVFFPPGTEYSFLRQAQVEMLTLNFDFTCRFCERVIPLPLVPVGEAFLPPAGMEPNPIEDCPVLNSPVYLSSASCFEEALVKMVQELATARLGYREKVSALLKGILVDAVRMAEGGQPGEIGERLLTYLREHYPLPLSAETVAREFGYHPVHLNRILKKLTGMTLHRYLIHLRLNAAEELLVHSDAGIEEITARCGFRSPAYFSDCFHRETGISPRAYRKQVQSFL